MSQSSQFIGGRWLEGSGNALSSTNPTTGKEIWWGREATASDVDVAVVAARGTFEQWAGQSLRQRCDYLQAFKSKLEQRKTEMALAISQETGKPRWEASSEVGAMAAKIEIAIESYQARCATEKIELSGVRSVARFKPHGVVAVLGPFNLPGHLPNGHIVPALLAGNTVVFKPSEQTPLVGQLAVEFWEEAGLPAGAINLVQGGRDTGIPLVNHSGIDGVYFTGSYAAGCAINRLLADRPGTIVALEMGGNNPLIVWGVENLQAAAMLTVQSAYITAGQRCSCARRLIISSDRRGENFLDELQRIIERVRVGPYSAEPEPFMGPLISYVAAESMIEAQSTLLRHGARSLVDLKQVGDCPQLLSPGLIDVTSVDERSDVELFGPMLQVVRTDDFDRAIDEANTTSFGLSAGLLSDDGEMYQRFFRRIRAGIVNWNRPLAGASSRMPFGGIGRSGNHRPAGFYSADYCAFPVASLEAETLVMPSQSIPGIDAE